MMYMMKSQAFITNPTMSIIIEVDDWMVSFEEIFDGLSRNCIEEKDLLGGQPISRISIHQENRYAIELDLGAYSGSQPTIEAVGKCLVVRGHMTNDGENQNQNYLQKGVNARGFRRSFEIGGGARVVDSDLQKGVLAIEIEHLNQSMVKSDQHWLTAS